jgi:hypothetical protein
MTEHTLLQVRELQNFHPLLVEVRFTGGDRSLMQNWLGSDLVYQPQGEGDLGSRMARSLCCAFQENVDRAAIIGTDCPGLNAHFIADAFNQLHAHDLVLGPAIDGGYYLISLRCFIKELFKGIDWGTAKVLQQTVDIAKQLDLSVDYLPQLADVDRPEDLPWQQHHW